MSLYFKLCSGRFRLSLFMNTRNSLAIQWDNQYYLSLVNNFKNVSKVKCILYAQYVFFRVWQIHFKYCNDRGNQTRNKIKKLSDFVILQKAHKFSLKYSSSCIVRPINVKRYSKCTVMKKFKFLILICKKYSNNSTNFCTDLLKYFINILSLFEIQTICQYDK